MKKAAHSATTRQPQARARRNSETPKHPPTAKAGKPGSVIAALPLPKADNDVQQDEGIRVAPASQQSALQATAKGNPYRPARDLKLSGATAPDGRPWIKFASRDDDRQVWVPLQEVLGKPAQAQKRLEVGNLLLYGEAWQKAREQADAMRDFPPRALIERPGWSPPYFALPSGEVFSPDRSTEAVVLFVRDAYRCAVQGKGQHKAWLKAIAAIASKQPLVTFTLMLPFAGPLISLSRLTENIGFELSGPKGVGKTTLQYLAASIVGPALGPVDRNYWLSANSTNAALEPHMPLYNDMAMVIEDLSAMYAAKTGRARVAAMRELVFTMAQGTAKGRDKVDRQRPARFVWFTSANDSTPRLLADGASGSALAAGDRLLALPISARAKHGVFAKTLPVGMHSSSDAAREIKRLVAGHHGVPMRYFLRRLVRERATDEGALKAKIEGHIQAFHHHIGVDRNDGSASRVADAFGLVYAAGLLAQEYGALPKGLGCRQAATACHRRNRKSLGKDVDFVQRLDELAKRTDVVLIDPQNKSAAYLAKLEAAPALLRQRGSGRADLVLTPGQIERAFPSGKPCKDPAVRKLMKHDGDRQTIKMKLSKCGTPTRVYCFKLDVEVDQGD